MPPAACLVAVVLCCVAVAVAAPEGYVQLGDGAVQGAVGSGYLAWLGLPFAATTGGANRFQPPQPVQPWSGVRNATVFGPGCFQTHHNPDVPVDLSEDCLNVNVYAPRTPAPGGAPRPVMVFFHGGSFAEGSNQGPFLMYDAAALVARFPEVVVVTANYRLGALGWVVTDALTGNLGLRDQHAALLWVRANIAAFGGDAAAVTIWGESAGAMSVGLHLINNQSTGLFHRAILESNPTGFHYKTEAEAREYGHSFCKVLGCLTGDKCSTLCLQQQTADAVGQAWEKVGNDIPDIVLGNWGHWLSAALDFTPTVDGLWVPGQVVAALDAGQIDPAVSVLVGSNHNEGVTFVYSAISTPLPVAVYEAAIVFLFGERHGRAILNYYHNQTVAGGADARGVLSALLTDYWFHCASEKFATAVRARGNAAYFFHFEHVFSSSWIFSKFGMPDQCANVTCHASELPFVFRSDENPEVLCLNVTFTADEEALIDSINTLWVAFATSGNPGAGWPQWNLAARPEMLLTTPAVGPTTAFAGVCAFWDSIGYAS